MEEYLVMKLPPQKSVVYIIRERYRWVYLYEAGERRQRGLVHHQMGGALTGSGRSSDCTSIGAARSVLPFRLSYNLAMPFEVLRSKRLGSVLVPFAVCIYGPGTVAIIPVDGGR